MRVTLAALPTQRRRLESTDFGGVTNGQGVRILFPYHGPVASRLEIT